MFAWTPCRKKEWLRLLTEAEGDGEDDAARSLRVKLS